MLINDPKNDPSRAKEVKVKIPMSHHVRLHSMKVLTGKAISDAVTEALEAYFVAHPISHPFAHDIPAASADASSPSDLGGDDVEAS